MLILFICHFFLLSETADKIDTVEAFREAKMDHQPGLSGARSFEMREKFPQRHSPSTLCTLYCRNTQPCQDLKHNHQGFLIKTHDWRQTLLLPTASTFAANTMLTHSWDWRQCVNTWELSWLNVTTLFLLERQVSFFLGQAFAVCSQGGFQPTSFSLFPFTPSDILEPLFDGLCLYFNIAYFSVYLRMFSYVYFLQSVPCCRLHTQTNRHSDTHSFSFILLQRNHCRVQTSHGLSRRVSQSVLTIAVFITPLYNVGVGTKTYPWTPESALAWLDHCRGKRVAVQLQKQVHPGERRRSGVSHFDLM